jgi:cytidylate kinase
LKKDRSSSNVITIDGPAGSGKSTVSRLLAARINYLHLDTGAMYRAVALVAKRKGIDPKDGERIGDICGSLDLCFKTDEDPPRLFLGKEDISAAIRRPDMDMLSSKVSAVKEVREAMIALQRRMAKGLRLVAEGRDMGTVVFPDAKYKFFLTASPEVRAERRYKERKMRGETVSLASVEEELRDRDLQDESRPLSPLRPAEDARVIDSSALKPMEVVEVMLQYLKEGKISVEVSYGL